MYFSPEYIMSCLLTVLWMLIFTMDLQNIVYKHFFFPHKLYLIFCFFSFSSIMHLEYLS